MKSPDQKGSMELLLLDSQMNHADTGS